MIDSSRELPSFLVAYAVLISVGTLLLLLPGATVPSEELSFFEALFTAVSAACLVGLTVVDTAGYFTTIGQSILLLLIQAGLLLYLFFAVRVARRMYATTVAENHHGRVLRRVVTITLLVEIGAFGLIFYAWGGYPFESLGDKLFTTAFHAVSAFGNAGFSVLDDNLLSVQRAFVLHLVVLTTFLLGGLGIDPFYDLFSRPRLRQRLTDSSVDWRPATKVSVNTSIILLGAGAIVFYLLEQSNTLSELNLTEKLIGSLFQSATARTAGFYTVEITRLTVLPLGLLMVLMFIGGGAGSTAGGIKTATLYRLFTKADDAQSRRINRTARRVVGYALAVNIVGTAALSLTETGRPLVHLAFEQVSAFSSVGLSPAITATLSPAGQTVVLLSMLLGRIGILTLMMTQHPPPRLVPQ